MDMKMKSFFHFTVSQKGNWPPGIDYISIYVGNNFAVTLGNPEVVQLHLNNFSMKIHQ